MPSITFILPNGEAKAVLEPDGVTAMEAALRADIPGIVGECGGAQVCGTCHVYVAPEWADRLSVASEHEDALLDFTNAERRATSRLACQITLAGDLEGLVLAVPAL